MEEKIWEVLARETAAGADGNDQREGAAVVVLKGRNDQSAKALLDRELIIRYFPFRIGRAGSELTTFRNEPDLALADNSPYHISRFHLLLERREDRIFLVDKRSRSGSSVDGILLGERAGSPGELSLTPGRHELRLGGDKSPFVFALDVLSDDGSRPVLDHVRFGDRLVPVSALYSRLYEQTRIIFSQFFKDGDKCLAMAGHMLRSILAQPGIIDPLYYFSAVPGTFQDMIADHSLNVAIYAVKLARSLPVPLTGEELLNFALAALFHDLGMYDIPRDIINKQEQITAEEYAVIKRHPRDGKDRLAEVGEANALLLRVAMEHHERSDGKGYPGGNSNLADYVELIAMVDFFEALTHYRPQRGPVTPHEGIRMLIQIREGIFRPALVKIFLGCFSLYPVYSVVRLNTGEIGQVTGTNPDWPLRPLVRSFFDHNGHRVGEGKEVDLGKTDYIYIVRDISDRIFVDHYFQL